MARVSVRPSGPVWPEKVMPMPIAWASACSNFETLEHQLSAKIVRRVLTIQEILWGSAMMTGLTILAVLTFIAIGEIRKTVGEPLKDED
jgi:hypothetical protein